MYTAIIALLPIIAIYSSGISGINLGELFLIIFLGYSIIFSRKSVSNQHKANTVVIFGCYIAISTLFAMFLDSSQINEVFVRTTRFIFYLLVIVYLSRKYFCIGYASKLIKNVSVLATAYIVIQNISYRVFGIILKGFLPFIPVYTSQYETYDYAAFYKMIFYRPTSFFLEPAHYSQYVLIGLVIFLFKEKFNSKNILLAIFLTLGVLLSTSGQGLIVAFMVWIMYALDLILGNGQSKRKRLLGMIFPVIAFIVFPFIMSSEVVQNNISRIFASGSNTAVSARAQGYVAFILQDNLPVQIFGAGFGNTPFGVWFSGLAYILYCSGIVGFIILTAIFLKYYLNADNRYTKMLILVCFTLSASAEIISSYWIVLMFSLFCYSDKFPISEVQNDSSESRNNSQYYLRRGLL